MVGNALQRTLHEAVEKVGRKLRGRALEERGAEMVALALTLPLAFTATMVAVQLGLNVMYMGTLTAELEQAADYVDVSNFADMSQEEKNQAVADTLKAYGLTIGTVSELMPGSLAVSNVSLETTDGGAHDGKAFDPYSESNNYDGVGSWTKDEEIEQTRKLYVDVNGNGQYDAGTDTLEGETDEGVNRDDQTILTTMTRTEQTGMLTITVDFKSPSIIRAFGLDDMTYSKTIARERVIGKQVEVQGS